MKFYLDDILINDEPSGDIVTTIKRDSNLGGFLITNDAKLKWHGDGFDYIQSVISSDGFCGEIECKIEDECNSENITIFDGIVFILEIQKTSNCIITAPLQDNSFYARINKNKSIEINIDTTRSKNGTTISAAKENDITMFEPSTGNPIATTRRGWRAYDIFSNLVAFMSDGEVEFDSNIFGIGGEFSGLSFSTGQEIAYPTTGTAIKTSFSKFFEEVKKKINCTIYIDTTGVTPVLRVESYDHLFTDTITKKLENINDITYRVDTTKLIATISVGSDKITDVAVGSGGVSFVESNIYQTFKTEDYTTLGQCNIDSRLDLVSSFVISSNTIEDCLMFSVLTHSESIFFIDCETVADVGTTYTSNAIAGNPFATSPPYFYNTSLFNSEVLERWNSLIPNAITNFQGNLNNEFRASFTSNLALSVGTSLFYPFQFNDDFNFPNFDGDGTANNYGNGTAQGTPVSQADSRYTCPDDGTYIFYAQIQVQISPITSGSLLLVIQRRSSGNVMLQNELMTFTFPFSSTTTTQTYSINASFVCDATDYITTDIQTSVNNAFGAAIIGASGETYFMCTTAPNSGGIINTFNNQNSVAVIKGDFEYPVPNSDFYDILLNPFGKIAITYQDKVKAGWIDTFQYNHETSAAKITILGSRELLL